MEPKGALAAKIISSLIAILCYGRVIRSFFTGEIFAGGTGRFRIASRSESPGFYWFTVAWYVGVATALLWFAFLHGGK